MRKGNQDATCHRSQGEHAQVDGHQDFTRHAVQLDGYRDVTRNTESIYLWQTSWSVVIKTSNATLQGVLLVSIVVTVIDSPPKGPKGSPERINACQVK